MSISTPRFNFFDKELLKDPEREGQAFDKLKGLSIISSCSGRGQILFGSSEGLVYKLDKQLGIIDFLAHTRSLSHIHQLKVNSYLFTIGADIDYADQLLCKIWNLEKTDSRGMPHCSRIIRLSVSSNKITSYQVSALAVHENMQLMAIGYQQGVVVLYSGDLLKEKSTKVIQVHDGKQEITGLAFRVATKPNLLFVTTSTTVLAYDISSNDKQTLLLHENYGCPPKCCAMGDESMEYQFLIGRADGVYYMQPEGRGGTAPLDGEKSQIHYYRGYLITVGKSNINKDMDLVTIYDTRNKFIAYSGPIPRVSNILFEWNSIYVLGAENRLYCLAEKPTRAKLDILFKKNQYVIAYNIAKSQDYDQHGLVDIFRLYGDYLYEERGDHDGAIEQYKKTIGHLEPSYVIRKFLDAQRLHNLTAYLEDLHKKQEATEDHTTLLLNCYTKLKDTDKLDEFIQKKDKNNMVNFDVETAIKVLRQSDYHRHALQLAEHHNKHGWYMKIQLENVKDYLSGLKYMQTLTFYEAESNMKKYGKSLINNIPNEATAFLKQLCLGHYSEGQWAKPEEFIHIFVNNSSQLLEFLEAMVSSDLKQAGIVYNTLLELYLQDWVAQTRPQNKEICEQKTMRLLQGSYEYAKDQALVLCHMHKFKLGILYLYEQGKLYQQIMRFYTETDDYNNVIELCNKWGKAEPQLWVMALSYFAQKEDDCKSEMDQVLRNIDEQQLLPPLVVIQTLASSKVCTLGVIKNFLMDRLKEENKQIEEDEKMIKQYLEETKTIRQKINDLKTKPVVFQVSRCTVCKYPMELPSIHFLCQHSYHTHCFESYAENENDCPVCVEENRRILETIKQLERSKDGDLISAFNTDMEKSKDKFDVIADYFGKGIFNKVSAFSEVSVHFDEVKAPPVMSTTVPSAKTAAVPRKNPFDESGSTAGKSSTNQSVTQAKGPPNQSRESKPVSNKAQDSVLENNSIRPVQKAAESPSAKSPQKNPENATLRPPQKSGQTPVKPVGAEGFTRDSSLPMMSSKSEAVSVPTQSINAKSVRNEASSVKHPQKSASSILSASLPKQLAVGHSRQLSAGKILESGLAFVKGHNRQSSDQSGDIPVAASVDISKTTKTTPSGGQMQKTLQTSASTAAIQVQKPSSNSAVKSSISSSSLTTNAERQKPKINPFEGEGNPFADESKNPFEDSREGTHASNPFLNSKINTNPFDTDNKNPFED